MRITLAIGLVLAIIVAALLISGCKSKPAPGMSKEEAINLTEQFVAEHVKFYSKNGTSTISIPEYTFANKEAIDEGLTFSVKIHVTATLGNESKERDMAAKVDKKSSRITEFNGQKVE